ncbi:MAG: type II toxin-antitoxin system MqsA family antitoxin [Opitutae bacterium]|jgi:DNA-binding transcriptional regulator YiaG|nr:type II toxin-antitoxin system MqsA family antitoxin [Opitutae bacterium]
MKTLIESYSRVIEWSDEDQCYIGRCPELFLGGCHGDSMEVVREQLAEVIAEVVVDYQKEGKTLPVPAKRAARLNHAVLARRRTGLNQKNFARAIGVGTGTLRNWEQGRVQPKGTAATLLKVVEKRPEILKEIAG